MKTTRTKYVMGDKVFILDHFLKIQHKEVEGIEISKRWTKYRVDQAMFPEDQVFASLEELLSNLVQDFRTREPEAILQRKTNRPI